MGTGADALGLRLERLLSGTVTGLRALSGGASRETWAFELDGRPLICQRARSAELSGATPLAAEVMLLAAAHRAGVPVPRVEADATDGEVLGTPGVILEHLAGETIPRRLLRDERYTAARAALVSQLADALAAIHRIPVGKAVGLPDADPLESYRSVLDGLGEQHPVLELGYRWLRERRPEPHGPTVVHGDFRLGNLMVDEAGLVAVLDWELSHIGDPAEDLGWLCTRAWRFGAPDPVAGLADRDALLAAYVAAGGPEIEPAALRWWEALGSFKWAVICMVQTARHIHGGARSVELAAIGRRTCEAEYDLLQLIREDAR